jgi:hypothetical protein
MPKKKAERFSPLRLSNYSHDRADQEFRLPGSTLTPGPIVDETAMR